MYLRKQGRRIYMLQTYRDGQGRVRQRRLGHFVDQASWQRQWVEFPLRCPELRGEFQKLREKAESLLESQPLPPPSQSRLEGIRRLVRALLNKLAEEEDEEVLYALTGDLQQLKARIHQPDPEQLRNEAEEHLAQGDFEGAESQLGQLILAARATLPVRRQRFDPSDPKANTYLQAADRLAEVFLQQSLCHEAAEVLQERVRHCPTPQARCLYGTVLQRLGRGTEAMEQYIRLPNSESNRHYNLASLHWQEGRHDQALVHLLRGFTWSLEPVRELQQMQKGHPPGKYWQACGELWDAPGRQFILAISAQPWVRRRLRIVREQGVRVRELISASSRVWLLKRGLEG